jgi:uncharacterized protein YggT (Ycf19 family)
MGLIILLLKLFMYALFARVIFSWVPRTSVAIVEQLRAIVERITEPVLGPVRRALPMLRVGGAGIDFSALVVSILVVWLIRFLVAYA